MATRILFICHGNICRSTMAQFVMEDLVDKAGLARAFVIDSAATSTEELGNPPHWGTVRKLRQVGVPFRQHYAWQVQRAEYNNWDYFIYMDAANARNLKRIFGGDPEGKCQRLLDFAPASYARRGADVADPWYTGNFDATYNDVLAGCQGLLAHLTCDN